MDNVLRDTRKEHAALSSHAWRVANGMLALLIWFAARIRATPHNRRKTCIRCR
jgi:hypothetical protein